VKNEITAMVKGVALIEAQRKNIEEQKLKDLKQRMNCLKP